MLLVKLSFAFIGGDQIFVLYSSAAVIGVNVHRWPLRPTFKGKGSRIDAPQALHERECGLGGGLLWQ